MMRLRHTALSLLAATLLAVPAMAQDGSGRGDRNNRRDRSRQVDPSNDPALQSIWEAITVNDKQKKDITERYVKLRQEQRDAMRQIMMDRRGSGGGDRGQRRGGSGGGGFDREAMMKDLAKAVEPLNKAFMSDVRGMIDDDQHKAWDAFASELDLAPQMRRRGQGRGQGQGQGRGQGRGQRGGSTGNTPAAAELGEMAPAFKLTEASGKTHNLSDYKGKTVVLQWINPECPVCNRVTRSGRMADMLTDLRKIDPNVVFLAVNSTSHAAPEAGAKYFASYNIKSPVLVDKDGTVGRLYGAKTTPHVYVIDGEGVLRYNGALDNDSSGRKADVTNYAVNALRLMSVGETVAPDQTKSYGCTVKYAKN